MPRAAQLSVRGFGNRWRGGAEMFGGFGQRLFEGLGVVLELASLCGAVGWVLLALATRVGLGTLVLPLAMAAAALVALLLLSIIGLSPGDWRQLGSGAGRGATRFARASGRGTVATAVFAHRLIRRWRQARLARRDAVDAPPPWAAPSRPPALRSVVTPLPDRREPPLRR